MRVHIIGTARIKTVGKCQSCMVSERREKERERVLLAERESEQRAARQRGIAALRDAQAGFGMVGGTQGGGGAQTAEAAATALSALRPAFDVDAVAPELRDFLLTVVDSLHDELRKLASVSGACTINRPCAQQYVGKSQSCMF